MLDCIVIHYQHYLCFIVNNHLIKTLLCEWKTAGVARGWGKTFSEEGKKKTVLCQQSDKLNNIETVRSAPQGCVIRKQCLQPRAAGSHVPFCWLCQIKIYLNIKSTVAEICLMLLVFPFASILPNYKSIKCILISVGVRHKAKQTAGSRRDTTPREKPTWKSRSNLFFLLSLAFKKGGFGQLPWSLLSFLKQKPDFLAFPANVKKSDQYSGVCIPVI